MKTKTLLVEDLKKEKQTRQVRAIIRQAKDGLYHNYESKLDFPKNQLVHDLKKAGLHHLAKAVINGRYD